MRDGPARLLGAIVPVGRARAGELRADSGGVVTAGVNQVERPALPEARSAGCVWPCGSAGGRSAGQAMRSDDEHRVNDRAV